MTTDELERRVSKLRELHRMADELAEEIAAAEDDLKAYMTATGTEELHGPSFKITWKLVTTRHIDNNTLKNAAPNLWELLAKQTTSRRFILE